MVRVLAGLLMASAVAGSGAFGQQPVFTPEMKPKIDAAIAKVLAETGTPSAQIGIAEGGAVVFTGAYGLARMEPAVASTVEMKYGVGSVSKQFTAAAAMVLVERGKLRLDDPVATWFPELGHARGDYVADAAEPGEWLLG